MTNEEIAALRAQVARHLKVYHETSLKALDDLCKAARQSNSLVGKRVRVYMHYAGTVTSDARFAVEYHDAAGNEFSKLLSRGDFELLEDTDA